MPACAPYSAGEECTATVAFWNGILPQAEAVGQTDCPFFTTSFGDNSLVRGFSCSRPAAFFRRTYGLQARRSIAEVGVEQVRAYIEDHLSAAVAQHAL